MHYRIIGILLEKINKIKETHQLWASETESVTMEQLELCQSEAITMGELVETQEDCDHNIITMLEKYCELIYELSQESAIRVVQDIMQLTDRLEAYILSIPMKYRVVFLPYKAEMWDSLESIWKAFREDEKFICDVVPIPYFEANAQESKWEMRYDGMNFPKDVPVVSYSNYKLEQKKPDIVFVHNPFDKYNFVTSVYVDYYSWELKKNALKVVYVPYYVNMGFISDTYKKLPSFKLFDYMVFQSENAKETCKGEVYYDRILPLGSPKVDKLVNYKKGIEEYPKEWGKLRPDTKKVLLNTTINDLLYNEESLLEKLKQYFELSKQYKDQIDIIWRPHPLLEATIKSTRPNLIEQYHELVDYFCVGNIGVYDDTGDVSKAVQSADAYIGSGYSSMIVLCMVANKPIYLFDGGNIHLEKHSDTNPIHHLKDEHYLAIRESDAYTLQDFFSDLYENRMGEVEERMRQRAKDMVANSDGTCGEKVHDFMLSVLEKELWKED